MSESCGNCGASTDREPLCEKCNDEDVDNTHGMAFAIEQLEAEVKPFRAREPLVQEVIASYRANQNADDLRDDTVDILEACRKLAEWKP